MSRGDYVLPAPEEVRMTGDAARRLVGCGSGDAALVYLYILSSGGRYDVDDCAMRTGRTAKQVSDAMGVLRRLGLVNGETSESRQGKLERADELPQYTTEDVMREMQNGEEFPHLVSEVQGLLGRKLSGQELISLMGIYDYLKLPPEVIMMLTAHCRDELNRRYGPSRRVTMGYLEKTAYRWEREGIFSIETADAYLKGLAERREGYTRFARSLGIRDRLLTATEMRYVDAWRALGFGPEAAEIAYDRTIVNTGKLSWTYMDGIMNRWHAAGIHTPEEIAARDTWHAPTPGKPSAGKPAASVTEDDLERLRRLREKM